MEDEGDAAEPELAVPAGAPIRVSEWLTPPLNLVGLAAIQVYAVTSAGSRGISALSIAEASLLSLTAIALWIFGYRAYRDLTAQAVERYVLTWVVSLFVVGALLSFATSGFGWVALAWSGNLLARRQFRSVKAVRRVMSGRLRLRTVVVAAIVGVACLLLLPVAVGLGFVPLVVLVVAGRIIAPFVFGFAFRLRPGASGIF
ncbi:hypothetical protein ACFVWR_07650 [Leifsonia sp. NPDC058292]|uniref:hypothetical protein n=1 Tax=Leifsonia sp. NPDC058292 TaxID=3346428 RepID=UPI0036DBB7A8